MEFFSGFLDTAFGPGDGSIFLFVSVFIGLATGRFSSVWLAVLFASALDVYIPGAIGLIEGNGLNLANSQALDRIAENSGSGILLRAIGYFAAITSIIMLKKSLGSQ